MSRVYVFSPDNTDYSTVGECGSLMPKDGTYELIANGMGEIAFKHPLDKLGKYLFLQKDAVLKIEVPVRTMPEIESGQFVTQVEKWTVKQTATKNQRYVYTKAVDGKKIKTLKLGAEVVVTQKPDGGNRWKIKSGKTSGWMLYSGLEQSVEIIIPDEATGIEEAAPAVESREQLFCIYDITRMDDEITCYARPIRYDLLYNLTTFDTSKAVTLQESLDGVLNNCIIPHDFTAKTNISASRTGAHYADKDPIFAILDPDQGLAAEYRAQFVSDNFELFLLQKAGANRGFRIAFGENMTGISFNENTDKVATVIRPIGEKKDGKPLYLEGDGVVVSPLADKYRIRKIYPLYCTDCKVGTNGVTTEIARARMREQAQAMFDSGADLPTVNVSVTFSDLGDTPRHKQYKNLKTVFLYDEVTVYHPRIGADLTTEVTRIVWDFVRDRMQTVELGSLMAMTPSVASWQIASGISGSKIAGGTIDSAQLKDEAISTRHVQAESINTQALQAESVTAEKIAAGAIDADKIKANALDTITLNAVTAKVESLTAADISTDRLAAALAEFTVLAAGTASFNQATIKHLVAQAMNLEYGTAGDVFINNLRVRYAQMVSATIGNLVIQASNGKYYQIDVDADGKVTSAPVTVSENEINAGQTNGGKVILATNITADSLNASNLLATYALINKIDAARIDVAELFAQKAFISHLLTTDISSNSYIQQSVKDEVTGEIDVYMRLEGEGVVVGKKDAPEQLLLDQGGVTVRVNGKPYSRFTDKYVQFGNYQLRKSADGGLVFKLTEG